MYPLFKIVCDLETAGNCPIKHGVISACFLIIDQNNNVIDRFVRQVRPPNLSRNNWSLDAQKVHGMTYEQVETFMSNEQFCYELLCFLAPYKDELNRPLPFICHASAGGWFDHRIKDWRIVKWFDYNFIEWCFRQAFFQDGQEMVWSMMKIFNRNNLVSTVEMGRKAGHKTNKLNQWAERIGFDLKHHDPTSDSYCCLAVFKYLTNQGGLNV